MAGKIVRPPFVKFSVPIHGRRRALKGVLHTTEGVGTVEGLAAYFRNSGTGYGINYIVESNGRMGSLGDFDAETWHVAEHNGECIGIEQVGYHTTTRVGWFRKLRQLWATAWVVAWISQELDIPLVLCARNRSWIAERGWCQHSQVPDNDHSDCGPGYPFGWILATAAKWQANGVPPFVKVALPKK